MSDERKEIVIKFDPKPKPGWACPKCGGRGHMTDGSGSISPTEFRYTPPSKCSLCNGCGRVNCTPADT
jgi:hypothetical protein